MSINDFSSSMELILLAKRAPFIDRSDEVSLKHGVPIKSNSFCSEGAVHCTQQLRKRNEKYNDLKDILNGSAYTFQSYKITWTRNPVK
jgi:hypothetical protein